MLDVAPEVWFAGQAGDRPNTRKVLWTVQDKGNDPQPLIFVMAGYGDAWVANGLARSMNERTVYYLQAAVPRRPPRANWRRPISK